MATEPDKTANGVLATVVVVGAFGMISVSALLGAVARSAVDELDAEHPQHADLETIARLKQQQRAQLSGAPRWAGPDKRRVRWSIAEAGKQVLLEYKADPLSASPPAPANLSPAGQGAPVPTAGAASGLTQPAAATRPGSMGSAGKKGH